MSKQDTYLTSETIDSEDINNELQTTGYICAGTTITKDLSETYNSGSLIYINKTITPFTIGSRISIKTAFSEYDEDFLVSKDSISLVGEYHESYERYYKHKISLTELTCILSGFMSDNLGFPLVEGSEWTFEEAVNRIIYQSDLQQNTTMYNKLTINIPDEIKNYVLPEFNTSNDTLLNNLNLLASIIEPTAYITQLKYNSSSKGYILTFVPMERKEGEIEDFVKSITDISSSQELSKSYNAVSYYLNGALNDNESISSASISLFNTPRSQTMYCEDDNLQLSTMWNIGELTHLYLLASLGFSTPEKYLSGEWYDINNTYDVITPPQMAIETLKLDLKPVLITSSAYTTLSRDDKEIYYTYDIDTNTIDLTMLSTTANPVFTVNKLGQAGVLGRALSERFKNIYNTFVETASNLDFTWANENYYTDHTNDDRNLSSLYGRYGKVSRYTTSSYCDGWSFCYQIIYKPYIDNIRIVQWSDDTTLPFARTTTISNNSTGVVNLNTLGLKNKAQLDQLNNPEYVINRYVKSEDLVASIGYVLKNKKITNDDKEYVLTSYTVLMYNGGYLLTETYSYNFNRYYQYVNVKKVYRDTLKPSTTLDRCINIIDKNKKGDEYNIDKDTENLYAMIRFENGEVWSDWYILEATWFKQGDTYCIAFKLPKDNLVGSQVVSVDSHKELNSKGLYTGTLEHSNYLHIRIFKEKLGKENHLISESIKEVEELPNVNDINNLWSDSRIPSSDIIESNDVFKYIYHLTKDTYQQIDDTYKNGSGVVANGNTTTHVKQFYPKGFYKLGIQAGYGVENPTTAEIMTGFPYINTLQEMDDSTDKSFFNWQLIALESEEKWCLPPVWQYETNGFYNYAKSVAYDGETGWTDANFVLSQLYVDHIQPQYVYAGNALPTFIDTDSNCVYSENYYPYTDKTLYKTPENIEYTKSAILGNTILFDTIKKIDKAVNERLSVCIEYQLSE